MEIRKEKRNNFIIRFIASLGLFLIVFGASYALFSVVVLGTKKNVVKTATLSLDLDETSINGVKLDSAYPLSDEEGMQTDAYTFSVTNDGTIPASYELILEDSQTNSLSNEYIRYSLIEENHLKKSDGTYYFAGSYNNDQILEYDDNNQEVIKQYANLDEVENNILDKTTLLPGEKIEYTLRMWLDEDADNNAMNKKYESNLKINGVQATTFTEGLAGEEIKYTLYNDGTLIFTGTGEMNGLVLSEEGEIEEINNNINAFGDIIYNYLVEKEMTLSEDALFGVALSLNSYYNNSYNYEHFKGRLSDDVIEYCVTTGSTTTDCDIYNEFSAIFNGDKDALKQGFQYIDEIPKVNRVVVDEGITKLSSYSMGYTGDYMISLPSTLTNIDFNTFYMSDVQYIKIPTGVTTLSMYLFDESNIRRLDLHNNLTTIESDVFFSNNLLKELNIPNSVTTVSSNAIISFDGIINIDNTKEFVDANWESGWIHQSNNATINYLR